MLSDPTASRIRPDQLVGFLDRPQRAEPWLRSLGLKQFERAHANLVGIARAGLTLDVLAVICGQLAEHLPRSSDPDLALNTLERYLGATRSPLSLGSLFERDRDALPILLQIFSTSQHLGDLMVQDPESFDLLRLTEGQPVSRDQLVREICSEAALLTDEAAVKHLLRRYKRRETLRIAYGDIIRGQRLDVVARQISFLADAITEAAVVAARNQLGPRRGVPRGPGGRAARFVALGLGKLGGAELNYSSDIDLVLLYDHDGTTDGVKPTENVEYFDRLARTVLRLLAEPTDLGVAYRVDLRLRPEGSSGPMVVSTGAALHYYDVLGRTWERQAFVKARPVAGDLDLGDEFLAALEPWIYRRYLSRADITGIKALKRRIEQRATREGGQRLNVKTGRGGIRDIEFVIQFLQLLNGGDLPELRTGNTLQAIAQLEQVGCLTMQERSILEENYAFLRTVEHRLQIMFDLQTHTLPQDDDELAKLAIRVGCARRDRPEILEAFKSDYQLKTELNRKILDHLLHDAFRDSERIEPEVDLVLDPEPQEETIRSVLGPYAFRDVPAAYKNLMALTTEKISFLSTRRCRHFLASIATPLLEAIAATPDPDAALVHLSHVSDSLGGKGMLWELFSFNPPSLHLYVRLCATAPYLAGILTSNPGMLDELMDSLVLDKLPTIETLHATLAELCRGAEDLQPILHSFKNAQHLRVGVRDILGKEDVQATTAALADIAEVCLQQITVREHERLLQKFGRPRRASPRGDVLPCELVILALGKLGGREPNYHSDLDIIFLYEADGTTHHDRRNRSGQTTSNQHFFSELGQRLIKVVNHIGPHGRLYELDPRLRPTGKSGALAVSLAALRRYFAEGGGQIWERQALCRARPIYGSPEARRRAMRVVRHAIVHPRWQPANAAEIYHMRQRLQETASPHNIKRGEGGTVDIEFAVQMLQLTFAATHPQVLVPGTFEALTALHQAGCLDEEHADFFGRSYRFLRSLEARLRLMNTTSRHDVPQDAQELNKLAFLLGHDNPDSLLAQCREYRQGNRRRFEEIFRAACSPAAETAGR